MQRRRVDEEEVIVGSDPTGLALYHLTIALGGSDASPPGSATLKGDAWPFGCRRWMGWLYSRRSTEHGFPSAPALPWFSKSMPRPIEPGTVTWSQILPEGLS